MTTNPERRSGPPRNAQPLPESFQASTDPAPGAEQLHVTGNEPGLTLAASPQQFQYLE